MPVVENRRQVLLRNLGFGAAVGGGLGLVQALSLPTIQTFGQLIGYALGGALGGAVLVVLASAILRWLIKQ